MSVYNLTPGDERLFEQILERAAIDNDFRQGLLDDPKATIEAISGVEIPFSIRFTERPADVDAYVVLPDFVGTDDALSEADLELVAGGQQSVAAVTDWCACTESQTCECTLFSCIHTAA